MRDYRGLAAALKCSEHKLHTVLPHLLYAINKWGIENKAAFLGQLAYESAGFTRYAENLNYTSAERIMQVWPSRFPTIESALPFVRNPEGLANEVYNGRMGNVASSNDGWRYRGRGFIQLTGRNNYTDYQRSTGVEAINHPDLLLEDRFAADSSGWFWSANNIDSLNTFEQVTRAVNGGTHGLAERTAMTEEAAAVLFA